MCNRILEAYWAYIMLLVDTRHVLGDMYGHAAQVESLPWGRSLPSPGRCCRTGGPLTLESSQGCLEHVSLLRDRLIDQHSHRKPPQCPGRPGRVRHTGGRYLSSSAVPQRCWRSRGRRWNCCSSRWSIWDRIFSNSVISETILTSPSLVRDR